MILIINNRSPYTKKIINIVKKHGFKTILKDQRSPLDDVDKKKVKGVILSGGDPNLDRKIDINQIKANTVSLVAFNAPIFGICQGFEVIAQFFGGEIQRLEKRIGKFQEVKILKKTKIFKNLPEKILMDEWHQLYVKKIPRDFVLTATSRKNKVEAIFHKSKPIFGVQFHPESSGENGEKIIRNFLEICHSKKKSQV